MAKSALKIPLIGNWLFMAFYAYMHRRGTEKERALVSSVEFIVDRQQSELGYRGFVPAILASLHGVLSKPSKEDHLMLATQNIEVTVIWGAEDVVIPISGKDTLMQWNAASRHIIIAQAGHGLAYTHAAEVVQCLQVASVKMT
jgi:pimeloyl-ACP methyl ester carboxylesterase